MEHTHNPSRNDNLRAAVGIVVLVISWLVIEGVCFDFHWHSAEHSSWIIPVGFFSLEAFLIGWLFISPAIERFLADVFSGDIVSLVTRTSIATVIASFGFRLLVPKESSWFGDLGDFFNPPLAFISLAILALALGLQREDLRSTRENLILAQKQLEEEAVSRRIADSPWILLKELKMGRSDCSAELVCIGSAPALNVHLNIHLPERELVEGETFPELRSLVLYLDCAALFSGDPAFMQLTKARDSVIEIGDHNSLPDYLLASIHWENIQGISFRYGTALAKSFTGIWRVSDRLYPIEGSFTTDLKLNSIQPSMMQKREQVKGGS